MTTYYPVKDQDQEYVSLYPRRVCVVKRVPVTSSPDRVEHIAVVCAESVLADPLPFTHGDVYRRGRKRSFDEGYMERPSCDNKRPRLGSYSEE